jgi:hypothetical protein
MASALRDPQDRLRRRSSARPLFHQKAQPEQRFLESVQENMQNSHNIVDTVAISFNYGAHS